MQNEIKYILLNSTNFIDYNISNNQKKMTISQSNAVFHFKYYQKLIPESLQSFPPLTTDHDQHKCFRVVVLAISHNSSDRQVQFPRHEKPQTRQSLPFSHRLFSNKVQQINTTRFDYRRKGKSVIGRQMVYTPLGKMDSDVCK